MFELLTNEIIKGTVSIAKNILGKKVDEINNQRLEDKKKKNGNALTRKPISDLVLSPSESISADFILLENETKIKLNSQLISAKKWSEGISFKDSIEKKSIVRIYIELETYLVPRRIHINKTERSSKIPIGEAISGNDNHCVILGQPGAGKTTSMKKLCYDALDNINITNERYPILIRFRDMKMNSEGDVNLKHELYSLFSYKLNIEDNHELDMATEEFWRDDISLSLLDELRPIIFLDGFDELASSKAKDSVLRDIRFFTNRLKNSKILLTCRTGEFDYHLENTNTFEISPLSSEQIRSLVSKWVNDENKAKKFLLDIEKSPFSDTAIKPLSLAHLCAIYERIGSIPDRPKIVYRKVVGLLLEEWDEQRSIQRESKYSKFSTDRKFEFLSHLAFHLTVNQRTTVFTSDNLEIAYKSICKNFGLPENQSNYATDEIESHTGLFLKTGYLEYEFAHKSLQEYLTAEYLVKLPSLNIVLNEIKNLGSELAVATSISSNPSLYFSDIVLGTFSNIKLEKSFYDAFVSRLIQEVPDFYPETDIVIAALTILNENPRDPKILELMDNIFSGNDICLVLKYYKFEKKYGGFNVLVRGNSHPHFNLNTYLRIPVDVSSINLMKPLLHAMEECIDVTT